MWNWCIVRSILSIGSCCSELVVIIIKELITGGCLMRVEVSLSGSKDKITLSPSILAASIAEAGPK